MLSHVTKAPCLIAWFVIGAYCKGLALRCVYDFYSRCAGAESSILSIDSNTNFQREWIHF